MRYLVFTPPGEERPRLGAVLAEDRVVSLARGDLPLDMLSFIQAGPQMWALAELVSRQTHSVWALSDVQLHTPLQHPPTLRDFYAFEGHVRTASQNRGREVPAEWYEFPAFYFTNPHTIHGPDQDVQMPAYTQALDYELEVAVVIGQRGKDIPAEKAMQHVFGFTIMNDWSARDIQRQEMKVGLGPAKGKDFATSLGPWIVTPDELAKAASGRPGVYTLGMTARLNGEERSRGNWGDIHYSFGEIIARASQGVELLPGDVIGSGTVGTGCLLELTKGQGPWLKAGDSVELEVEGIGVLKNKVA
ncbi:MAG: fumarylacetoacetate hydrolase family protein [Anaerolineales bacterium]|nr:fumarylacetoacetate hydrolase family protein [Anaerolineales bacterium]MCW5854656.1 fumarylacetoacetate hydrolase family protein [Anaerolineales bacterium]